MFVARLVVALLVAGCTGRMPPDQQIAFVQACDQARRDALAATDPEPAIERWALTIQSGKGLCRNGLYDALILGDEPTHRLAVRVLQRLGGGDYTDSLLSDLESSLLTPEQRARVVASLRALTRQDFGEDRAAWEAWFRAQR